MKTVLMIGLLGALAGCGAGGDPLRPTAKFDIDFGQNGVTQSASVGARNSNVNFSIGAGG